MLSACPESRVEQALASPVPFQALLQLATELRDSGMGQSDLRVLYEFFLGRHRTDPDESLHDALADTLDFITGWCSPGHALYGPTVGCR